MECPKQLKHTSLCFFSKELIDLVNKTNSKLLYADFLLKNTSTESKNKSAIVASTDQDDYTLLNTFEMLWNIDSATHHKRFESSKVNSQKDIEETKELKIESVAE